jgi:hypothetical protein
MHTAMDIGIPRGVVVRDGVNNGLRLLRCGSVIKIDERLALNEVIKETYGSVDGFFNAFERERRNGFWTCARTSPYQCILGPGGNDLVEAIKDLQRKFFGK